MAHRSFEHGVNRQGRKPIATLIPNKGTLSVSASSIAMVKVDSDLSILVRHPPFDHFVGSSNAIINRRPFPGFWCL